MKMRVRKDGIAEAICNAKVEDDPDITNCSSEVFSVKVTSTGAVLVVCESCLESYTIVEVIAAKLASEKK